MRVSAKADYALRAAAELAAAPPGSHLKREQIAEAQDIPVKFLENILLELKHVGIVRSYRGSLGGYSLARPAAEISLADILRAVDGPMADVRGERIETLIYRGAAERLRDVWVAVRASLRDLLENTTLADLVEGHLSSRIVDLTHARDAWISHGRVRGRVGISPQVNDPALAPKDIDTASA
jgi:Rrf2 family protein